MKLPCLGHRTWLAQLWQEGWRWASRYWLGDSWFYDEIETILEDHLSLIFEQTWNLDQIWLKTFNVKNRATKTKNVVEFYLICLWKLWHRHKQKYHSQSKADWYSFLSPATFQLSQSLLWQPSSYCDVWWSYNWLIDITKCIFQPTWFPKSWTELVSDQVVSSDWLPVAGYADADPVELKPRSQGYSTLPPKRQKYKAEMSLWSLYCSLTNVC